MSELSIMALFLFSLIIIELSLFFIMNGSDFGAGMSTFLVRDEKLRNEIVRVSAPVWFGNETWIVVGMATMFGAFPRWYSALTSGLYIVFILTLIFFIIRGTAFDYRLRWKDKTFNSLWDWGLFLGSILPPFLITIAFAVSLEGVPIAADGTVYAGFFDIITPFSLWSGFVMILFCLSIGISRVMKFVSIELNEYLRRRLKIIVLVLPVSVIIEVILMIFYTNAFMDRLVIKAILIAVCAVSLLLSIKLVNMQLDRINFWNVAVSMACFLSLIFISLFPNAIVGVEGDTITLAMAASGPTSQFTVTVGSCIMLPLLALGQIVAYIYQDKDYGIPDTAINE